MMIRQIFVAACVAAVGGMAMGQGEQPGRHEPPLRGPGVVDRMPPGWQSSFTGQEGERTRMEQARVPHDLFMRAVFSLDAPEAPRHLRLTDGQRLRIQELQEAFRRDVRAHVEKHADELRGQVRRDGAIDRPVQPGARPGGAPGGQPEARPLQRRPGEPAVGPEPRSEGRPGARPNPETRPAPDARPVPQRVEPDVVRPPTMDERERRAHAQRLAEIRRSGPRIADVEAKVWNLLTEEQQVHVGARLEAARREIDARRDEAYREMMTDRLRAEREARGLDAGPSGGDDPARRRAIRQALERGDIPAELLERLPERARERLRAMSPEDRRRAIERLMERRFGEGRPEQPAPGQRRPPPPMDSVDIPEPR
ncbi:MAG: hypothetical protein DPW19_01275 [cyanobacterium CYA1]|nr:hypothetical protein [cyanobacterium CYA1]